MELHNEAIEALAADLRTRIAAIDPTRITDTLNKANALVTAVPPEEVRAVMDRANQILEQMQDTAAMLKATAANVLWVSDRLRGVLK